MKRILVVTLAVLASGFVLLGFGRFAAAQSFHTGDSVTLHEKKAIDSTVYAAGNTVAIDSEVFGDVFCAGQTVTITSPVHGDVICAAQNITISAEVDGDVRLAGQTISINSYIHGNASIATQSFVLDNDGMIMGDASIGASSVTLRGEVSRDVLIGANSVSLGGIIGRNVTANTSNLRLLSSAAIGGDIDYTSKNALTKDTGATVAGTTKQTVPTQSESLSKTALFGIQIAWFVYAFIAFVVTGFLLALVAPKLFKSATEHAMPKPWKALLVGFLAHAVAPIALFILFITLVGAPAALLVGGLWLLLSAVSSFFAAFYVGRVLVSTKQTNVLLIMLVGTIVIGLAQVVPVLNIMVFFASLWLGSGMLLLLIAKNTGSPTYDLSTPKTRKK